METNSNITLHASGENNSACAFAWLIYLLLAIGCGVLIFMMIAGATEIFGIEISRYSARVDIFSTTNFPQFANASFWVVFSLIMLVVGFVETVIKTSAIEKTSVNITADSINGKYVSSKFNFGAYRAKNFSLAKSEIDNVKVSKNFVEIYSTGKAYRVYVKNSAEIQNELKK